MAAQDRMSKQSHLELLFDAQIEEAELPPADEENYVIPGSPKRWQYDRVWLSYRVIVEIEGGVFTQGRHTRGMGFVKDCNKYNWATSQGWKLYRFTVWHLNNDLVVPFMRKVLV
jgi:hypothetical protein